MKQLFAYIRVSDPKQGKGVSLDEQRSIVEAYASKRGLTIIEWFVETRTAAKTGRPVFDRMVKSVSAGEAAGFIVHKLDRTTRNWYDWAQINDLVDRGIEVHNASEGVELGSNGSRLAADMEIVVAVHYIRNLRQEALKGIHGRLQQGILPHGVGIGYLDRGAGKPKEIDPVKGPLVRRVLELYSTGAFSVRALASEAESLGLRNRNGRALWPQEIHKLLRNPFYSGVIRSKRFGLFEGAHAPLISRATFDRNQDILAGRFVRRTKRYDFLFRRILRCASCSRALIGSLKKGRVYYRCSNATCPTTSVREDAVEDVALATLDRVTLTSSEARLIELELAAYSGKALEIAAARKAQLEATLASTTARSTRLTDLLIDGAIDASEHAERRDALVAERQRTRQALTELATDDSDFAARARRIVELARSARSLYETADALRKRQLLEIVLSNCTVSGKNIAFAIREPFATIANREFLSSCGPHYDTPRTFPLEELVSWCRDLPEAMVRALDDSLFPADVQPAA